MKTRDIIIIICWFTLNAAFLFALYLLAWDTIKFLAFGDPIGPIPILTAWFTFISKVVGGKQIELYWEREEEIRRLKDK